MYIKYVRIAMQPWFIARRPLQPESLCINSSAAGHKRVADQSGFDGPQCQDDVTTPAPGREF